MNTTPITELVADAREHLALPQVEDNTIELTPGSDEANYVEALHLAAAQLAYEAKVPADQRKLVTETMRRFVPEGATITIGGVPYFSHRIDHGRALDTKLIQAEFPDDEANAELWKDTERVVAEWKKLPAVTA
jgi:hypothetical protein